jgi:hypothetical protein
MQLGGIGNSLAGLNAGGPGVGSPAKSDASSWVGSKDSSADIYASVYQAGSDEYMMDDGSLDVYA